MTYTAPVKTNPSPGEIRVLDRHLANQIAAGEIVESPLSVVRELVDNSLDAGANDIQVRLENGGHKLIAVSDNGSGIGRDYIEIAFLRHATSKLRSVEDLMAISTQGFRGEALPSIASVSTVQLSSRSRAEEAGSRIIVSEGKVQSLSSCACPTGTTVEVKNLFFNVPARKKFLKTERGEALRVKTWLRRFSILWPEVRFRLIVDGKETLNMSREDSMLARGKKIFSSDFFEIEHKGVPISVVGLIGHPSHAAMNRSQFILFANNRIITDRSLIVAIRDGFDSMLKPNEHPAGFLSVQIEPDLIDVNVHPQKSEVRFKDPSSVFRTVRNAVRQALSGVNLSATPISAPAFAAVVSNPEQLVREGSGSNYSAGLNLKAPKERHGLIPDEGVVFSEPLEKSICEQTFRFSDLKYIGQVFSCYLICEKDNHIHIVDMHAAHERYNFNLIRNSLNASAIPSQKLMFPLILSVEEDHLERFRSLKSLFHGAGFIIEEDASSMSLIVSGIPGFASQGKISGFILDAISEESAPGESGSLSFIVDQFAARLACHGSVRSGYVPKKEEVYALFESLDSTEFSSACPHGRPVLVSFSEAQVEKWFGRDR